MVGGNWINQMHEKRIKLSQLALGPNMNLKGEGVFLLPEKVRT